MDTEKQALRFIIRVDGFDDAPTPDEWRAMMKALQA